MATQNGNLPDEFDLWEIDDRDRWSVAHEAAFRGHLPPSYSRWLNRDIHGVSVAHAAEHSGTLPPGFDLWDFADRQGVTVAQVAAANGHLPPEFCLRQPASIDWALTKFVSAADQLSERKEIHLPKMKLNIVSLFSGAGGLDLGLIQAGNRVLWAADSDDDSSETYWKNIGSLIVREDIRNVSLADIPEADVIVADFPDGDILDRREDVGVKGYRDCLFGSFIRILKDVNPLFFVMAYRNKFFVKRIYGQLSNVEYSITHRLVNAADFGVPRNVRIDLIFGQRVEIGCELLLDLQPATHGSRGYPVPWQTMTHAVSRFPDPYLPNDVPNHEFPEHMPGNLIRSVHCRIHPDSPYSDPISCRKNQGAITVPIHFNVDMFLTVREYAAIRTCPNDL
ncbi:MAG: DNA cytosine methyltransferase [Deltaproteobacteria bacterium]|jgi:DNA (cytosine-5)-methyltransferase 1|nr:DNA cytosine methyltransferase [Deltaproteobacteria bacterium]